MARSKKKKKRCCFNKMICGGSDSVELDDDDLQQSPHPDDDDDEGKRSNAKRPRWSFRKRPTKSRVLSSTITTETKDNANATNLDIPSQTIPSTSPKKQWTKQIPPLSTSKTFNPLTVIQNAQKVDALLSVGPAENQTSPKVDTLVSVEPTGNESARDALVSVEPAEIESAQNIDALVSVEPAENESARKVDALVSVEPAENESARKVDALVSVEPAEKIGSLIISEDTSNSSQKLEESSAITIQASVRRYLAQKELLKLKNKLKNIVKLQAAFRGHLERRKAIGTLRCVQAIVKMQALVRARSTRFSSLESATEEKIDVKHDKIIDSQGQIQSGFKSNTKSYSTEKFLTNGFARQLLESAPNRKQIHIKCDPSKADSAWKWLERWVSVSTSESAQTQNPGLREGGERVGSTSGRTRMPTEIVSNSMSFKKNGIKEASKLESEEHTIAYDANNLKFQVCHPSTVPTSDTTCDLQNDGKEFLKAYNTSMDVTSRMEVQLDATCQILPFSVSKMPEEGAEQPKHSMERAASEQPDNESKMLVFGSKKACNPAFAAAQSKFEELSSSTITVGTNTSSKVVGVDTFASVEESETKKNEHCLEESLCLQEERVHIGGSDCGTELSISSTLDSPNSSNVGVVEFDHENDITEKITPEFDNGFVIHHLDVSNDNGIVMSESNTSFPISQHENLDDPEGECVETAVPIYSAPFEQQPDRSASHMQVQMENQIIEKHRSSSEESPTNHIPVQELHGTPASQVSFKGGRRNKLDKDGSTQGRKSLSTSKRSPSNPNHDSGGRHSVEKLPKDSQNGKRRNSFGSSRHDHADHDPRDSSSNSLPSYMQATESARAKALTGSSPRSSPDMQDKDTYLRKRHSLPGTSGKQGSPRILRSLSHAQQGAKGNATHNQGKILSSFFPFF
ncbi:hypothetical protein ACHQM5_024707 [Ranunculus cassubicifolius]